MLFNILAFLLLTIVDNFSLRAQCNARENTFESISDDDKERPIIGVVFPKLSVVYHSNYIEIHQLCIICGFTPHKYSHLFGSCNFVKVFYKESGEVIHWKLFTNIESLYPSAR